MVDSEFIEIKNCYDSHTHFLATGETQMGLSLHFMTSVEQIQSLDIKNHFYRSDWIFGFGWNHHLWPTKELPNRHILDQTFKNTPVYFSRVDGHCGWMNTEAMNRFKALGIQFNENDRFVVCKDREFTGVVLNDKHIECLLKLPLLSDEQIRNYCLGSIHYFNKLGFTHIRDLSMNSKTAQILSALQKQNLQTLCIEGFITTESVTDLQRAFDDMTLCSHYPNPYLRIKGLKIFIDGSLGSKTAFLSQNYLSTNHCGQLLWSVDDIKVAIQFCWTKKIEIAIHAIGDEAVHTVAVAARSISAAGLEGKIHIEHAQHIRTETLQLLKPLHLTVHMQPIHFLSDESWMPQVVDPKTIEYSFRWDYFVKNKIPVYWGSDSPIEAPSIKNTINAVQKRNKILKYKSMNILSGFQHPSASWGDSKTILRENEIVDVYFDNKKII